LWWGFCQPRPRPARSATSATNVESRPLFKPSETRRFHLPPPWERNDFLFPRGTKEKNFGESPPYWPNTLKYNHRYRHRCCGLRSCTRNRLHPKLHVSKRLRLCVRDVLVFLPVSVFPELARATQRPVYAKRSVRGSLQQGWFTSTCSRPGMEVQR
jgi:hypothetical protein